MKCYADDDLDSDLLLRLALSRGHEVISPRSVGQRGVRDATHLAFAVRQGIPILSGNTGDFEALHELALALGGKHYGILLVYGERSARREMRAAHIVNALTRLETGQVPLRNSLMALNHYR